MYIRSTIYPSFALQLSALLLLFASSFHLARVVVGGAPSSSSTFHDLDDVDPDEKPPPPPFRSLSGAELERFLPLIGASPGRASMASCGGQTNAISYSVV